MIGLLYLLFFAVYFAVSIAVILTAYFFARRRYRKGWVGGWLAAFVMYNLVFWDWIPVLVMHKYYCATEAGFWVFQEPEEWIEQHPSVLDEDWEKSRSEELGPNFYHRISQYWYGSLLYWQVEQQTNYVHRIYRTEEKIVDAGNGRELSKVIEFSRGNRGFGGSGLGAYKLWLGAGHRTCGENRDSGYRFEFSQYLEQLRRAQKAGHH